MALDLLCIGLTTLDVAIRPIDRLPVGEQIDLIEGVEISPAGTAAGAAMVAATLGVRTGLAGAIGDDRKGRFVRFALDECSVDTSLLDERAGAATSTTVLAIDASGRRPGFHAPGAGFGYRLTDAARQAALNAKFVHWAGVGSRNLDGGAGAELLASARAAGAVVTCDLISPRPSAMDELRLLLPHVDYFLPSAVEALSLSGAPDLPAAAAFFTGLGARACIIKNGGAGSYLDLGDQRLALPAHAITPVDTTSCGDSYCAGLIAGLLSGFDPIDAARFATTTAALVAQGLGTLGKLESFENTLNVMRSSPPLKAIA